MIKEKSSAKYLIAHKKGMLGFDISDAYKDGALASKVGKNSVVQFDDSDDVKMDKLAAVNMTMLMDRSTTSCTKDITIPLSMAEYKEVNENKY